MLSTGLNMPDKNRPSKKLSDHYTQPSSSIRIVGILPTDEQLDAARLKLKRGDNRKAVVDELLETALRAESQK